MNIIYRNAVKNDVEQLIELRILMQLEINNNITNENISEQYREKLKQFFETSISEGHYIGIVALDGLQVIATAGVCFYRKPPSVTGGSGVVGYVTNVFTKKSYRGQGICTHLMGEISTLAHSRGVDRLHLGATKEGSRIYKAIGYRSPNREHLELNAPFFSPRE